MAGGCKYDGAQFEWAITVPPNTRATGTMPEGARSLNKSGNPIATASGVRFLRIENNRAVYELQSGLFVFEMKKIRYPHE